MSGEPTIGFNISWIARMMRTRFDARARALGLTRAQWMMMVTIQLSEGATQSELASRLEINTVTAGRIIDRLEAAGWSERRQDRVDRRVNRLYLTPAAAPMLESLAEVGAEEERVSLRGIDLAEQAVLADLLDRMVANLRDSATSCAPLADDDLAVSPTAMGSA